MKYEKERQAGAKMGPPVEEANISAVDICMVVSVLICLLSRKLLNDLGLYYTMGDKKLEVLQHLAAPIGSIMVCQKDTTLSIKAGVNRLKVTAVGAGVGIAVVLLETLFYHAWSDCILVAAGVLLSVYLCKLLRLPYVTARIGGVTCILVACTMSGTARIPFACFRLLSTLYGAVVAVIVTAAAVKLTQHSAKPQA